VVPLQGAKKDKSTSKSKTPAEGYALIGCTLALRHRLDHARDLLDDLTDLRLAHDQGGVSARCRR
jgi:hypothetical protein